MGHGRARGAFSGLAIAGLVWCTATLLAAVVAAGPAGASTCPHDGLARTEVRAELQLVPFGPTCRHERIDPFGTPYDDVEVDPPEPVWRTALAAGALTGLVGAAGLVGTRRDDDGADAEAGGEGGADPGTDREREPVAAGRDDRWSGR
ncbi:hypothetical protein [Dermatobacter hominis]|uniref:hypothetical protein n=1 Tax=Dermatobacter hominis TaxID=2884263 RepID=UPI001D10AA1F|nr:hypothetical protein [Dermatobacter hominis]UDY36987.1 hypothetical protein LH044_05480 [Dermatobacter hominis]